MKNSNKIILFKMRKWRNIIIINENNIEATLSHFAMFLLAFFSCSWINFDLLSIFDQIHSFQDSQILGMHVGNGPRGRECILFSQSIISPPPLRIPKFISKIWSLQHAFQSKSIGVMVGLFITAKNAWPGQNRKKLVYF
jgi:hypothetical protein